jgi:hypothetical protein
MKVKTNVLVNGPHVGDDLEEWVNELAGEGFRLVTLVLTERPDEPMRVIARAVVDRNTGPQFEDLVRVARDNERELAALHARVEDVEAETKHAHEEVGALVSIVLEVHRLTTLTALTDAKQIDLIKDTLTRCVEAHPQGGTVVNLSKLVPFGVMPRLEPSPQG